MHPYIFNGSICIIYTHLDKHRIAPVKCNKCSFVILKKEFRLLFHSFSPFHFKSMCMNYEYATKAFWCRFYFSFLYLYLCAVWCVYVCSFSTSTSPSFVLFSFDSFASIQFFLKHSGIMSKRKLSMKIEMRIHYIFAVAAVERRHSKLPFAQ